MSEEVDTKPKELALNKVKTPQELLKEEDFMAGFFAHCMIKHQEFFEFNKPSKIKKTWIKHKQVRIYKLPSTMNIDVVKMSSVDDDKKATLATCECNNKENKFYNRDEVFILGSRWNYANYINHPEFQFYFKEYFDSLGWIATIKFSLFRKLVILKLVEKEVKQEVAVGKYTNGNPFR